MTGIALVLSFLGLAFGHNWMISPSRVPFAATNFPCMGARTIYPHVQVSVGQDFELEWSTGHDRFVYFVLMTKNDSVTYLSRDITATLEAYITEAPSQLYTSAQQKFHRTPKAGTATHVLGGTVASHYGPEILPGNPLYRYDLDPH